MLKLKFKLSKIHTKYHAKVPILGRKKRSPAVSLESPAVVALDVAPFVSPVIPLKSHVVLFESPDESPQILSRLKRSPKILSFYAAGWSKKTKVASFLTLPPRSWAFKLASKVDGTLAKLLFKVPIVGR